MISMSFSSGAYLGNHSTASQWARSASAARLAYVDGTIVEDKDRWLGRRPGSGAVKAIERVQMHDEVGAWSSTS